MTCPVLTLLSVTIIEGLYISIWDIGQCNLLRNYNFVIIFLFAQY